MKTIKKRIGLLLIFLCCLMITVTCVQAQKLSLVQDHEAKKQAWETAKAEWELHRNDFRTTRLDKQDPSFEYAVRFLDVTIDKIIAHLQLVRDVAKNVNSTQSSFSKSYEVNIPKRIQVLQESKSELASWQTKYDILKVADDVEREWEQSSRVIIREIVLQEHILTANKYANKLDILISKLNNRGRNGLKSLSWEEEIINIQTEAQKVRENIYFAQKELMSGKEVGRNLDVPFQRSFTYLRESRQQALDILDKIIALENQGGEQQ